MSCATAVMYSPYSPYSTSSTSSTSAAAVSQYHGFAGSERILPSSTITSASSPLEEDNNNIAPSSMLDGGEHKKHHHPHQQPVFNGSHSQQQVFKIENHFPSSSSSSPSSSSHQESPYPRGSPPTSRPPSHLSEESQPGEPHRLSSNVIVFTNYVGDVRSVVEDHFCRALNPTSASSISSSSTHTLEEEDEGKEDSEIKRKPMSARNFPASFWNAPSPPYPPCSTSARVSYTDLYPEHGSITGALHQLAADWQYPNGSSNYGTPPPRHSVSPHYSPVPNYPRFSQPSYWTGRLGPSSSSSLKSEWCGSAEYIGSHQQAHHQSGDFTHHHQYHYSNMAAGLDGMPDGKQATDLYWSSTF